MIYLSLMELAGWFAVWCASKYIIVAVKFYFMDRIPLVEIGIKSLPAFTFTLKISLFHTSLINSPGVEDSTKPLLGCGRNYPSIVSLFRTKNLTDSYVWRTLLSKTFKRRKNRFPPQTLSSECLTCCTKRAFQGQGGTPALAVCPHFTLMLG